MAHETTAQQAIENTYYVMCMAKHYVLNSKPLHILVTIGLYVKYLGSIYWKLPHQMLKQPPFLQREIFPNCHYSDFNSHVLSVLHSFNGSTCVHFHRCSSPARRLVHPTPERHYATPLKPGGSQVEGPGSTTGCGAVHL